MNPRKSVSPLLVVALLVALSGAASAGKITVDPNAGAKVPAGVAASSDPRLAQKVSYEARHRSVHLILADFCETTGVKFIAGASKRDWPVRDRKMNVFVKDTKLADVMNSIARVMKFRWSASEELDPPVYRLIADRKAVIAADEEMKRAEQRKEDIWQTRRDEWIDAIEQYGTKPPVELESLRQTNPVVYRYTRYGAVQALHALFDEVPEIRKRFAAGQGFRISSSKLGQATRSLVYTAGDNYWKYLQMSGQVGEATDDPAGYGDGLHVDDRYDIAFVRMDEVGGFTPGMRWGGPGISAGYLHLMADGRDKEVADLRAMNEERSKLSCEGNNRFLDGERKFRVGDEARYARVAADEKKMEEFIYPSEPLNEHPDFPELDKTIKLKIEPPKGEQDRAMASSNALALAQKALAEASGLGVVSDSWVSIDDCKISSTEAKLSEMLDEFSESCNYNWDMKSGILEFRHRKWWRKRLNQIPDEWIETWRESTRKNGMLGLEDLAKISSLNYYQAEESLQPDKVLGLAGLYRQILSILDRNLHWLRLYNSLSPSLRTLLTERNGVNGFMLTQEQWKVALTMFDRIGSSRGDALFRLERVPDAADQVYTFREIDTDSGEEDRTWTLRLPRYTPPPEKQEKK